MRVPLLPAFFSRCRLGAAGGLFLCLTLAACSKQGQGERCDLNNGDLDCEGDLLCKGEASLNISGRGVALCCPRVTDESTVDACRQTAMLMPEGDAGPEPTPVPLPEPTPEPDAGAQPDASPATP